MEPTIAATSPQQPATGFFVGQGAPPKAGEPRPTAHWPSGPIVEVDRRRRYATVALEMVHTGYRLDEPAMRVLDLIRDVYRPPRELRHAVRPRCYPHGVGFARIPSVPLEDIPHITRALLVLANGSIARQRKEAGQ